MNVSLSNESNHCLCERLSNNSFYYAYDTGRQYTFVSSGVTRLLGYSKESFSKHYPAFLTNAACNDAITRYTEIVLSGTEHVNYEIEIYKKDRSICQLEIDELPIVNDVGKVIAVEGIARDISEKKQTENALKHVLDRSRHQDQLQAALDGANAGIFSYDIINDKTWWDTKSHELFSVNSETFSNTYEAWRNLVFSEDLHDTEKKIHQVLTSNDTFFELTYRILTKGGTKRWINVKAQITRNKHGQAIWIDGLHFNITHARELEIKLVESKIRFRNLVENSPDWIWETDTEGHYIYTSPYIKKLLGYKPKEILGQTIFSLMPGDERIRLIPVFQKYFSRQSSFSGVESINLHKDGTLVTLETNASPMFDIDRNFTGYRGIHRDVTERKLSKQLKQEKEIAELANTSKSEFLANMSHELRTPMHAILSFSKFGINKFNKAPPEKLRCYFEKIHFSGERLLSLLNDLLDLSTIEAGKLQFDFSFHDLDSILKQVLSEQEELLNDRQLTINAIPPKCKTTAQLDNLKIAQVITNFISNAIKFSNPGTSISIEINKDKLFSDQGGIEAIRLSVSDQGVGIPDDELEYIFDKFIQSSKTKSNAGGTGLGLSICKEFIDAHHGRIWAEHNPCGGSIFNFVIPLEQPSHS